MKVTIFNWNVNGIRALLKKNITNSDNSVVLDMSFVDYIKSQDFTIVALQETKINNKSESVLDTILTDYPYKYSSVSSNSRSGVAVFTKLKPKNIVYELSECKGISKPGASSLFAGRYLELEFENFYYVCVYQPNSGSGLERRTQEWDPLFRCRLMKLMKKKEVIISGDFNVVNLQTDTWNYKGHYNKLAGVYESEMVNFKLLLNAGFYNVYRYFYPIKKEYTYYTYFGKARANNRGMQIDYFLVTKNLLKKVENITIIDDIYGSDHLPLELTVNV